MAQQLLNLWKALLSFEVLDWQKDKSVRFTAQLRLDNLMIEKMQNSIRSDNFPVYGNESRQLSKSVKWEDVNYFSSAAVNYCSSSILFYLYDKWSTIHLKMNVRCADLREDNVWIVFGKYSCFKFLSYQQSTNGELALHSALEPQWMDCNVNFDEMICIVCRLDYSRYNMNAFCAIPTIAAGKMVYIDYGSSYKFMYVISDTFFWSNE